MRRGDWQLLDVRGWPDNPSCRDVLAWAWEDDGRRHVVVVNFRDQASQGRVVLPWPGLTGRAWRLTDLLDGRVFERDGDEMAHEGLFVDLPAWGAHVLAVE